MTYTWTCMNRRGAHEKRQATRDWKSVQLPEDLLDEVDAITKIVELGYTSRSEFIKEAVRLRLGEIETQLLARSKGLGQETNKHDVYDTLIATSEEEIAKFTNWGYICETLLEEGKWLMKKHFSDKPDLYDTLIATSEEEIAKFTNLGYAREIALGGGRWIMKKHF